ncbi:MAG: hypothetical protein IPM98_15515 [Lewinellaceae bacterium]|nr:hypothetical protein [Lewinellaceae bacterium]
MADMDVLLAEAEGKGDSLAIYHLNTRMLGLKIDAGRYEEAYKHIAVIEKMPVAHPIRPAVLGKLITAARGRAKLAMIKKDIVEAEINYQKALKLTEDGTQPWIEVHILDALTELEWDRGNRKLAKILSGTGT